MEPDGERMVVQEALRRRREAWLTATTVADRKAAAATSRHAKGLLIAYWQRRLSEGGTTTSVALELGIPYSTFRRWSGMDPRFPEAVSQRERYVEAFIPVEIGSRLLAFSAANPAESLETRPPETPAPLKFSERDFEDRRETVPFPVKSK